MKFKHLIITKLALKGRYDKTGLSWEEWLNNSIFLMDKYCRPSLKNQVNQNFTLISRIDDSVNFVGNILNNEIIVKNKDFGEILNNIIKEYDSVIITRLDRDDSLKFDFVENIQKNIIIDEHDKYIDIKNLISYDTLNDKCYKSDKYNNMISPFVSTYEVIKEKMDYFVLRIEHNKIGNYLKGEKCDNLCAMQVIHEYNLLNKITGKLDDNINLGDYGINI